MRINWHIFVLAFLYSFIANSYFGWNFKPESDAELISDGIFVLIVALSFRTSPSSDSGANQ